MRLIIGLDYELFFGRSTGSIEHCLIEPMTALMKVLDKYGVRVTLFVDSGYLVKLQETGQQKELSIIQSQLNLLAKRGHDLQLHIHPHWEDSHFTDNGWDLDTTRYRLHNFPADQKNEIVSRYKAALTHCAENEVFAYRAGGWCLQPFTEIADALQSNGIWLDSTVFKNGISTNPNRSFNFSDLPEKPFWRFSDDPTVEDSAGDFVELPIGSIRVGPSFFWHLAIRRKLMSSSLTNYGDGQALANTGSYYLTRLTTRSYAPVAIDGLKAGLLEKAYRQQLSNNQNGILNVMGHPKSLTPYSIDQLDKFLSRHEVESVTCQDFADQKLAGKTDNE
ncbi:MAG: hypothetical protein ACJAR0_001570 [Candidatus Azotimanducaceae bacterium]